MYYCVVVNKKVPCLVMIRRLGSSSQYIHILGLGRLSPIFFLPCKPLHGLGRGLDTRLTTTSYAGSDAKDEDDDDSRYLAGRRKGMAARDSSRPRVYSASSQYK